MNGLETKHGFIKYPLARIGENFRVSFRVITAINETSLFKGKVIKKSTIVKTSKDKVNYFYDVSIHPYVEIDFTAYNDKLEYQYEGVHVSDACKINLNKQNLYLFIKMLKRIESDFVTKKDLYFYRNGELVLNHDISPSCNLSTMINNKMIYIAPIVVKDEGSEKEYEGIYLALSDLSNKVELKYSELGYLIYVLSTVNMDTLATNLVTMVGENNIVYMANNTPISINNASPIIVQPPEEDNTSDVTVVMKNENVIPNI